jgi:hypothetical protein
MGLALGGVLLATTGAAAEERFSAFAVNVSNIGTGQAGTVLIRLERYSTDRERDRLFTALSEGGEDQLLRELQKLPEIGGLRTPRSLEWRIHFARERKSDDGGRRIVMLTDRPVSFWEARNRPRTMDYPFTLIELRLPAEGKGEGKLSLLTSIRFDKEQKILELEDYASEPVRLSQVTVER